MPVGRMTLINNKLINPTRALTYLPYYQYLINYTITINRLSIVIFLISLIRIFIYCWKMRKQVLLFLLDDADITIASPFSSWRAGVTCSFYVSEIVSNNYRTYYIHKLFNDKYDIGYPHPDCDKSIHSRGGHGECRYACSDLGIIRRQSVLKGYYQWKIDQCRMWSNFATRVRTTGAWRFFFFFFISLDLKCVSSYSVHLLSSPCTCLQSCLISICIKLKKLWVQNKKFHICRIAWLGPNFQAQIASPVTMCNNVPNNFSLVSTPFGMVYLQHRRVSKLI